MTSAFLAEGDAWKTRPAPAGWWSCGQAGRGRRCPQQITELRAHGRLGPQDDARLAALVGRGDRPDSNLSPTATTFRCSRSAAMLGDREDRGGQQTFLRAHQALPGRRPPMRCAAAFAIAPNRCRTMWRRAGAPAPTELPDGLDDLAERGSPPRRAARAGRRPRPPPGGEREALVLAELGDLSHPEIGAVIGLAAEGQGPRLPGARGAGRRPRRPLHPCFGDPRAAGVGDPAACCAAPRCAGA